MASSSAEKSISLPVLNDLISAHDGDVALLYLWSVARSSDDREAAARELCRTMDEISSASEKLSRILGSEPRPAAEAPSGAVIPDPAEETREYTAEEISRAAESDPAFSALIQKAAEVTGRQLSRPDLSRLMTMYNHLGLSAEVLYVLLDYCALSSRGPSGSERRPTMYYIEKQAFAWARMELDTAEAAEEYVEKQKSLETDLSEISKVLEIYDRRLTPTERNNITQWLEWGFDDEAIRLAYERTLDKTGKRAFAYMNTIILSWHKNGLHTVREIEKNDAPPGRKPEKGRRKVTLTEF